ncbi:MAG: hypothetical protein WC156_12925 [Pedobacter sp.]
MLQCPMMKDMDEKSGYARIATIVKQIRSTNRERTLFCDCGDTLQGKTLIIQSGCHGSFLGRLDLEIDGGRVVDYRHQLIEVEADIIPDPAVADLVRQALAPYQEELSTVVGETAMALNRATALETTMDNFLLQALLESTGAQLAFSNVCTRPVQPDGWLHQTRSRFQRLYQNRESTRTARSATVCR